MPTYDYRCAACRHEFEDFHSIRAPALRKCPKCGKAKLERLIGPGAGVLFKGGGFYQTDYRSESYKRGESSESGGKASEGAKEGGGKASEGAKEGGSSTAASSPTKSQAPKPDKSSAEPAKKKPDGP